MKLKDAPHKMVKLYDIKEQDVNQFKFDPKKLPTMLRPNLSDFSKFLNRASVGLSATKKHDDTNLICFNRVGYINRGTNYYTDASNAFDILKEGHIALVDEDNTDGIECLTDFYLVKKRLAERLIAEVKPIVTMFMHIDTPRGITIADFTKVGNAGMYVNKTKVEFAVNSKNGINGLYDPALITMSDIRRPLLLTFSYGLHNKARKNFTIGVHPKKNIKGANKTIVESSLAFYRSEQRPQSYHHRNSYYDKAPFISLTEIDADKFFHQFIVAYNNVIKDFNEDVETLMEKYVAMYMLNSIGLQSSVI